MVSKSISIGGGGFLMEPENSLLDRYCLNCTVKNGELPLGIAIDDGAAVLFEGQQIIEVVASRPTAKAYQIILGDRAKVREAHPITFGYRSATTFMTEMITPLAFPDLAIDIQHLLA
jgi:hypothetical protein